MRKKYLKATFDYYKTYKERQGLIAKFKITQLRFDHLVYRFSIFKIKIYNVYFYRRIELVLRWKIKFITYIFELCFIKEKKFNISIKYTYFHNLNKLHMKR